MINFTLSATSRNDIKHGTEETEEDRVLLPDMKTSYVPINMHPPLRSSQRHKRDIDGVLYFQANSKQFQTHTLGFLIKKF